MKKLIVLVCTTLWLGSAGVAQNPDSVFYGPFNNVLNATQITLFDSGSGTYTTLIPQMLGAGRSRGGRQSLERNAIGDRDLPAMPFQALR